MSIGWRVIVDFVFELAWAVVWAGQNLIKIKIEFENHPKIEESSISLIKVGSCLQDAHQAQFCHEKITKWVSQSVNQWVSGQ